MPEPHGVAWNPLVNEVPVPERVWQRFSRPNDLRSLCEGGRLGAGDGLAQWLNAREMRRRDVNCLNGSRENEKSTGTEK